MKALLFAFFPQQLSYFVFSCFIFFFLSSFLCYLMRFFPLVSLTVSFCCPFLGFCSISLKLQREKKNLEWLYGQLYHSLFHIIFIFLINYIFELWENTHIIVNIWLNLNYYLLKLYKLVHKIFKEIPTSNKKILILYKI